MNPQFFSDPAQPGQKGRSRRSLLRSGSVLGLTAIAAAGLTTEAVRHPAVALAADGADTAASLTRPGRLVLNYQPSQPTGWPKTMQDTTVGMTIGGHNPTQGFTHDGTAYQVSLLPFGQPTEAPDPVYEDTPGDPTINFKQTLATAYDAYYAFRYRGATGGWGELSVESYSVFVTQPTQTTPLMAYGLDLYVVYRPGGHLADPAARSGLQWIQVAHNSAATFIDDSGRANPFYFSGGSTSVYGKQVVNFTDRPQAIMAPTGTGAPPNLFMAELFLAQDTGVKDAAGKAVVNIFGGIKYGWAVTTV